MIHLQIGNLAFLQYNKHRVPCEIVALADDTYGVGCMATCTAPAGDIVDMEFPVPGGRDLFHAMVIVNDMAHTESLILQRAGSKTYAQRRKTWRIPLRKRTTATAPNWDTFQGNLINISKEGALFETNIPLEIASIIHLCLPLNGVEERPVEARVLRKETAGMFRAGVHRYGLLFQKLPSQVEQVVTLYIWDQLRKHFPERLAGLFPGCGESKTVEFNTPESR